MCDGGSLGCANFRAGRPLINGLSWTDVFWFLHGVHLRQVVSPELRGWHEIGPDGPLRVIDENRDIICGVKFSAIGKAAQTVGIDGAKAIKEIATDAGLPLMVHLGICDTDAHLPDLARCIGLLTKRVLQILERGDIVTHVYTPKVGGMIKRDGRALPEFRGPFNGGSFWTWDMAARTSASRSRGAGSEKASCPTPSAPMFPRLALPGR